MNFLDYYFEKFQDLGEITAENNILCITIFILMVRHRPVYRKVTGSNPVWGHIKTLSPSSNDEYCKSSFVKNMVGLGIVDEILQQGLENL